MKPLLWVSELNAELPPAHEPRDVIALLGTVFGPRYSQTPMFELLPLLHVAGSPDAKSHEYKGTPSTCANGSICEMKIRQSVIKARFSISSKIGYTYRTNKTISSLLLKTRMLNILSNAVRILLQEGVPAFVVPFHRQWRTRLEIMTNGRSYTVGSIHFLGHVGLINF